MNVFELYAKIALDTGDYEKGLEDAREKTSGLADIGLVYRNNRHNEKGRTCSIKHNSNSRGNNSNCNRKYK